MSSRRWDNGRRQFEGIYATVIERDGRWLARLHRTPRRIIWQEWSDSRTAAKSSASKAAEAHTGAGGTEPEPAGDA